MLYCWISFCQKEYSNVNSNIEAQRNIKFEKTDNVLSWREKLIALFTVDNEYYGDKIELMISFTVSSSSTIVQLMKRC